MDNYQRNRCRGSGGRGSRVVKEHIILCEKVQHQHSSLTQCILCQVFHLFVTVRINPYRVNSQYFGFSFGGGECVLFCIIIPMDISQ